MNVNSYFYYNIVLILLRFWLVPVPLGSRNSEYGADGVGRKGYVSLIGRMMGLGDIERLIR